MYTALQLLRCGFVKFELKYNNCYSGKRLWKCFLKMFHLSISMCCPPMRDTVILYLTTILRYSTLNWGFIITSLYHAWSNYMCHAVFYQKLRNFYRPDFFSRVMKMAPFTILNISGKGVFLNSNLWMMKTNNNVNFLELFFLVVRNKTPNTDIPYKYADWI